jgi:hypothetical protein
MFFKYINLTYLLIKFNYSRESIPNNLGSSILKITKFSKRNLKNISTITFNQIHCYGDFHHEIK